MNASADAAAAASDPAGMAALEAALEYAFQERRLAAEALTHPSLENADRGAARFAYQRLEFLGDRVLGLVVADLLLERFPDEPEGDLAKRLSALVRRETLAEVAGRLGLGRFIRLSQSEAESGGRENPAILADVMEALIGAVFRDGGWPPAKRLVAAHWAPILETASEPPQDAKSRLQEWAQARALPLPAYRVAERSGPAHQPEFTVEVAIKDYPPMTGLGGSKRAAEQAAAEAMLARLEGVEHDG